MSHAKDNNRRREETAGLDGLPTVFAAQFQNWTPDGTGGEDLNAETARSASSHEPAPLSDAERRFLRAIIDEPGLPSSAYPKRAGISSKRAQRLRQTLAERGFLREQRMSTSSRGHTAIVFEPLPAAFTALGEEDHG